MGVRQYSLPSPTEVPLHRNRTIQHQSSCHMHRRLTRLPTSGNDAWTAPLRRSVRYCRRDLCAAESSYEPDSPPTHLFALLVTNQALSVGIGGVGTPIPFRSLCLLHIQIHTPAIEELIDDLLNHRRMSGRGGRGSPVTPNWCAVSKQSVPPFSCPYGPYHTLHPAGTCLRL